jgi:hypothetical protein
VVVGCDSGRRRGGRSGSGRHRRRVYVVVTVFEVIVCGVVDVVAVWVVRIIRVVRVVRIISIVDIITVYLLSSWLGERRIDRPIRAVIRCDRRIYSSDSAVVKRGDVDRCLVSL